MKILIVIVGPTAVGKTALTIQLAKSLNTPVISADSRQLFKEMAIGTAKPTAQEMEGVPHYFVDSHSIHQEYSVGHFEREVLEILERLFQKKDVALMAGGSGLYVKAVCEGLDEMPNVNQELRASLNDRFKEEGLENLLEELQVLDPQYYEQVDRANHQRVIRALEVCKDTGKPFSSFRKNKMPQRFFKTLKIGLKRDREELYLRINQRMDLMIGQGLLEEAKGLYTYRNHTALQTVGYKEIFDFMVGKYDWTECVRLLKRNTRHFAKRQLTWFNKDQSIRWFHPEDYDSIMEYIEESLNR